MPPSAATGPTERPRTLDALTGLRFFAAFAVGLYHIPFVLPLSVGRVVLPDGALGVSFFFILSGFILTHVYRGQTVETLEFYRRRFARIYPLHLLTLLVWISLFFQSWGNSLQEKINSTVANVLLLQAFFSGPLFNLGLNAVSWSISVEAFFYAIFPLARRAKVPFVLAGLCVLFETALPESWYAAIQSAFPNFFYFNPFGRLLEFSFGIVCYSLWFRLRCPYWAGAIAQVAAMIVLAFMIRHSATMVENFRNAFLIWGFGAVIVSFALDGPVSRLLGPKPFIVLGESSFAFYMIHHMFFRAIDAPVAGLVIGPLASALLALSATTVLAIAIHYLFERPARYLLRKRSVVT